VKFVGRGLNLLPTIHLKVFAQIPCALVKQLTVADDLQAVSLLSVQTCRRTVSSQIALHQAASEVVSGDPQTWGTFQRQEPTTTNKYPITPDLDGTA